MAAEIPRKKLAYYAPVRDRKHTVLRVPQSHSLHICPSACSRRNVINAIRYGDRRNISCLHITEADIVSGHYENIIGDAIADLLEVLMPQPRIFLLYFKCIDDFLGTDESALLQRLRTRFTDIEFACCHIDPVALDGRIMPGMLIQSRMYSFLKKNDVRDNGMNLIGSFVHLDPECELHALLKSFHIGPIRMLFECVTYEDYQQMAQSRFTMILSEMGKLAAQEIEKKTGIPYCYCPTAFDPDAIVENYRAISGLVGKACPDFGEERERAFKEIALTRKIVGPMPIIVDSAAATRVFALARMLVLNGFNVRLIFASRIFDGERADFEWLKKNRPELRIEHTDSYENILGCGIDAESLTLGYECASVLRSDHYVDLWHDEGFYGFHGLHKLMRMMREAVAVKANWKNLNIPGKF